MFHSRFTSILLAHSGECEASVEKAIAAAASPPVGEGAIKVLSWNVDGWRSKFGKEEKLENIKAILAAEDADVLCFQETKLQQAHVADAQALLADMGYPHSWFAVSGPPAKKGYSGVAIAVKPSLSHATATIGIGECDAEGRVVSLELPGCYIVNTYVPNSGMKLARLDYRVDKWDPAMREHLKSLQDTKPVVWLGDLNVANQDMDIYTPASKADKSPGFTYRERDSFKATLETLEMQDAWRVQNPLSRQYSFFTTYGNMRSKNSGWRLDYTAVSKALMGHATAFIRGHMPYSDHVPIGIVLGHVAEKIEGN